MATTTTTGKSARIGLAKQTGAGNGFGLPNPPGVATGMWPRWQQGASVGPVNTTIQVFEGDGSLDVGLNIKTGQWGTATMTCLPRPKELAMLLTAFTGTTSDTITGAGPYTHTITPLLSTVAGAYDNDFYTIALNLGSSYYAQLSDAICHSIHMTTSVTAPQLQVEPLFTGLVNTQSTTPAVVNFLTDGPFYFFSSAGGWTLDTLLFGAGNANWAGAVRSFDCTLMRELRPEAYLAETITPLKLQAAARTCSGTMELLWQDGGVQASAFFNNVITGPDSSQLAYGSIQAIFKCDSDVTQTFTLTLPKCSLKSPRITPNLNGDPVTQSVEFTAFRNAGAGPYTAVCINTGSAAY